MTMDTIARTTTGAAAGQPLSRRSLADLVFDRLYNTIKSGALGEGERLPAEHELAAEFEVSRPIVREALRRLREQGLILSRRGSGSFVRRAGLKQPLGFGQLENVADLLYCYEFRLTLEPSAAHLAALRRDPTSLAPISEALELMRDATSRQLHREDADFQFHLAIAEASRNSYFATSMAALKEHIAVGMRFHGVSLRQDGTGLAAVFAEHRAIFEAIRAGDAAQAQRLMQAHLAGSRERVVGHIPPHAEPPHAEPPHVEPAAQIG